MPRAYVLGFREERWLRSIAFEECSLTYTTRSSTLRRRWRAVKSPSFICLTKTNYFDSDPSPLVFHLVSFLFPITHVAQSCSTEDFIGLWTESEGQRDENCPLKTDRTKGAEALRWRSVVASRASSTYVTRISSSLLPRDPH